MLIRTSIGGDDWKLVRVAALVVQIAHDAHLAGAVSHLEVGHLLEAVAQRVVDHCVDAAVRIACRHLGIEWNIANVEWYMYILDKADSF